MNKTKNTVLLTAAITSIVLGVVAMCAIIVDWVWWGFLEYYTQILNPFMFACGVLLVVYGSLLCKKQNRTKKAFIIGAIVSMSATLALALGYIVMDSEEVWAYAIEIVAGIAALALLIAGLRMNDTGAEATTATPAAAPSKASQQEAKIELLKKMKAEGQITEKEYKELLMKELEK